MGPLVRLPEKRPGKTVGLIRDPSGPLRNWSAFREETVTAPLWMAGECPGARAEYAGSLGTSSLSGFSRHLPLMLGHGDGEQTKPEAWAGAACCPGTDTRPHPHAQLPPVPRACEVPAAAILGLRLHSADGAPCLLCPCPRSRSEGPSCLRPPPPGAGCLRPHPCALPVARPSELRQRLSPCRCRFR